MGLDLDPFYYTETMVRILREQGHTQLAMELAELILEKNGEHPGVRALFEELKTDARRAFERFKNSGRASGGEAVALQELAEEAVADEPVDFPRGVLGNGSPGGRERGRFSQQGIVDRDDGEARREVRGNRPRVAERAAGAFRKIDGTEDRGSKDHDAPSTI